LHRLVRSLPSSLANVPEEISGECATPDSDGLFDADALVTGDVVSLVLHPDGLVEVLVNGVGWTSVP
jgi:hypothetical protein